MSSHFVAGPIIWFGPVPHIILHAHLVDFYIRIKSLFWTLTSKWNLCLEMGRFYKWWPLVHWALGIHCYLIYSLLIAWKWLLFSLQWKLDCNTPPKLTPHSALSHQCLHLSHFSMSVFPQRTGDVLCPTLERSSIFRYKLSWDVTLQSA